MTTPSPATSLTCTQCGGELHPDEGQQFVTCPYCSATVYIDRARVVFHWYLAPTLNDAEAAAALRRWMSGSQTVKDLDQKARIIGQQFQYFPVWYFRSGNAQKEETALELAAASSVTELRGLQLPAGDLRKYEDALDSQSVAPSVPLEAALSWLKSSRPGLDVRESSLTHIPLYIFKYTFKGQTFTAVVEAATGTVLANIFPAKAEAPYLMAGALTALVYLCLATFPFIGGAFDRSAGTGIGVAVMLVVGILAAPFLFAFAMYVASKI